MEAHWCGAVIMRKSNTFLTNQRQSVSAGSVYDIQNHFYCKIHCKHWEMETRIDGVDNQKCGHTTVTLLPIQRLRKRTPMPELVKLVSGFCLFFIYVVGLEILLNDFCVMCTSQV